MTIRVQRQHEIGGRGGPQGGALRNIQGGQQAAKGDNYANRVVKLIPAEALGLFGTGSTLANPESKLHETYVLVLAAACLLVTILFRYIATKDVNGKPQLLAIFFAIVSFCLWFLTMKPPMGLLELEDASMFVGLAALLWATVVPVFYKGD